MFGGLGLWPYVSLGFRIRGPFSRFLVRWIDGLVVDAAK